MVEHAPNVFAHAPMADNDDVILYAPIQGVGKGSALVQPLPEEREFLEKRLCFLNQVEQEGVDHNRDGRGGEDESILFLTQHPEGHPKRPDDKGKFTDLAEAGRNHKHGGCRRAG